MFIIILAAIALGDPDASDLEQFEKEVRPILASRCLTCHGPEKQKGGLRLDSRASALKGGSSGPAVVPGKLEESVLIEAINYGDLVQMPPKSMLPPKEIAALTRWVERGAAWPEEEAPKPGAAPRVKPFDLKERAKHWSFQPVSRVDPPEVKDADWPRSPIDRFLLDALEKNGLKPAPDADKRTLLRRATYDLTGLPPTREEIDEFVYDEAPDAFAKVVDRLLASPRYGERWGRHWLDLVRYAETSGHEFDYDIPDVWRYRDYVVRAFNDDLPYDRFLTEHVAGDLVANPRRDEDGRNESILATGFYFLGEGTHSPVDVRDDEIARNDNAIDVMSKTFLGLTVSCARCHDHKFDAISTKDYYALAGVLKSSRFQHEILDDSHIVRQPLADLEALKTKIGDVGSGESAKKQAIAYLSDARRVVASGSCDDPRDVLFDDFEGDRYEGWTSEGKAFGDGPIHLPVPDYQGNVACRGRGLVGSHNGRLAGGVTDRDALTGVLTSREFIVDHDYIHFLVGGGSHPGKTCVDLLVDGEVADSRTGRDENAMRPARFDARRYRGRRARLRVVDDDSGGWGNISLDHVVFSDLELAPGDLARAAASVALADGLDAARLARWVAMLAPARPSPPPTDDRSVLFEDFAKPTFAGWTVSGPAFGESPTQAGAFRVEEHGPSPVPPGVAHSGMLSDRLAGVLRSRTFVIESQYIHILTWGRGGRINVVVDGFEKIRDPIYGALFRNVDSEAPAWVTLDVSMWRGHRAYLELGDGATLDYNGARTRTLPADGYLAVDEVRFSDRPSPPAPNPSSDLAAALDRGDFDATVIRQLASRGLIEGDRSTYAPLVAKYRELECRIPPPTLALAILDGTGEDEHVLIRGGARTPGELVPRRFLEALGGQPFTAEGSGRLALAEAMLAPSCPLTARVMANRIWKGHFGVGLVRTPDDFGIMGEAPSHPELLDWLASEFVANGWSVKQMHRMMMLSHAYAMSSELDPEAETADGTNRLLHRMSVRRLEAEAVRDAMLAISGRLDPTMGGPSVAPPLTPLMDGRGRPDQSGPIDGDGRRSLYVNVRRNFLSPMLLAFDFPAPASTMGRRNVSNVPAQALTMLNDPFVIVMAKRWADRLLADVSMTDEARVDAAFVAAFGRPPTVAERSEALAFVAKGGAAAWADLCHVLFNAKEFLFVP